MECKVYDYAGSVVTSHLNVRDRKSDSILSSPLVPLDRKVRILPPHPHPSLPNTSITGQQATIGNTPYVPSTVKEPSVPNDCGLGS